jgi:hypothetical protein
MPSDDRLPAVVLDYGAPRDNFEGESVDTDPGQVLVEQFAVPLMRHGTPALQGIESERELVRAALGVVGSAATLIAAITEHAAPSSGS